MRLLEEGILARHVQRLLSPKLVSFGLTECFIHHHRILHSNSYCASQSFSIHLLIISTTTPVNPSTYSIMSTIFTSNNNQDFIIWLDMMAQVCNPNPGCYHRKPLGATQWLHSQPKLQTCLETERDWRDVYTDCSSRRTRFESPAPISNYSSSSRQPDTIFQPPQAPGTKWYTDTHVSKTPINIK
jgi:hypothetical protein